MLKKIISVFLAFSILNANIFALDFNYKEFSLLRNEIAQTIKPITDFDIRTKYRKEYNFKALFDSINHQGFNNNYGQVCDGDFCAPYHTFMRGLIGALIDFSEGDGSILINYTREIRNAVFMGALASRDINNLRKLLKDGIKETVSSCGTNPLFEEIEEIANTAKENLYIKQRDFSADQKAQDNCEKGLAGLSILSVVWENKQQADETADLIYKTLKKRYKSKFSSLVLLEGIAALSFVDTDYSYQLIEQFLTKDSIPSRIGTALREISFQGMYDSEERRIEEKYNNATSYLNRINAMWQYIDEDATMQRGVDPNIFKQVNSVAGQFDDEYLKAAYNVVYNNTLTDIGAFLSTQGERGQKLARKLLSNFVSSNAEEKRKIHIPLILGLIQNTELSYALPAARIINESFYYDIGGGAGSLIAQKSAIEGSNLNEQANNTISEKYYLNRAKVGRVNFILGLFIQVVSMGFLALSIANAVANIYNLASFRLNRLNFIVDMGNGGAAAGKSAQIAQMGKAARSLPAAKPALPQAKAAAALPQAEATQALPQAVETLALPQPEVTSAPVLSQPKTPIVQSLVVPNILSKIRNKYTKQDIFTPVAAMVNGDKITADMSEQSLTETSDPPSDLGKSVFRLESHYKKYYSRFSGFLGKMPIESLKGNRFIFSVAHGPLDPYTPIQVFNDLNEPLGTADILLSEYNDDISKGPLRDLVILVMRQDLNVKPVEIYSGDFKKYKNCTTLSYPAPGLDLKSKQVSQVNFSCGLNDSDIGYLLGGADPGDSGGVVAAETSPNNFKAIGSIIFDVGKQFTFFHSFNWLNNLQDKLKYFLKDQLQIPNTINLRKLLTPYKQYRKYNSVSEAGQAESSPQEVSGVVSSTGKRPRITIPTASTLGVESGTNFPYYLKKSVLMFQTKNIQFTGYLVDIPFGPTQYAIGPGHAVLDPNQVMTAFDSQGNFVSLADVVFYKYIGKVKQGIVEDFALISLRNRVNAKPFKVSFTDINNYRNLGTLSFPNGKFAYRTRSTPTSLTLPNNVEPISIENISFITGNSPPGSSGGVVVAETSPGNYSAVGTIIANYYNQVTMVQGLNWLKSFLQGKLRISYLVNPKEIFFPGQQYGKQLEIPFGIDAPSDITNQSKGSVDGISTASREIPFQSFFSFNGGKVDFFPDTAPLVSSNDAKILRKVVSAELMPYDMSVHHPHAVWKLKDKDGNVLFYLKYGTPEEIARTKRLHEVVSNSDLIKNNPLVKINYPQIVAEGDIPLRVTIKNSIEQQLRQIKPGLWGIGRGKVPFVMTVLRADGFKYDDLNEPGGRTLAMHKLYNKPITYAEWKEIEKIFEELNKNGVVHPDLPRNFEFARDNNDFLNNDIYDLEDGPENVENNKEDLQDIKELFERYGIKESNNPRFNYRSQYIGSQFWF